MTPYNTGKVRIGQCYTPPNCTFHDQDAILLQKALLPHGLSLIAHIGSLYDSGHWAVMSTDDRPKGKSGFTWITRLFYRIGVIG